MRLRGSRCFDERAAYEALVATTIVARLNARVAVRLIVERATLRALAARRTIEYEELPARVSKYAVLTVRGTQYNAPSQLAGQRPRRDIDTPIDPFQAAWRPKARGRAASGLIETAQCISIVRVEPLVQSNPQRLSAVLTGC